MFQRRGTKSQWETTNPVLAVGEIGFSFNENVIKIGDGATAWNSLESLDGKSAYELAVAGGYSGTQTQWLASLAGDALPTQTGQNGKFLTTNGTSPSWATVDLSSKQNVVSGVSDTEIGYLDGVTSSIQTQLDGKASTASGVPSQTGNGGKLLTTDGTTSSWSNTLSGGIFTGSGSFTGSANVISNPAGDTTNPSLSIRAISAQASDLLSVQDQAGSTFAKITIDGDIYGTVDRPLANSSSARSIGFIGLPQVNETAAGYTVASADAGKHLYSTQTRTVTIPSNSTRPFEIGTTLVFISNASATTTIAITSDTLLLAGSGAGGAGVSRTLAPHGMATAVKVAATTWYISGNGLT